MKRTFFALVVAALAAMSLVSCEKESVPTGRQGADPATDVQSEPLAQSLVGTHWSGYHYIRTIYDNGERWDGYWDFIDDSTLISTMVGFSSQGEYIDDTSVATFRYRYSPDTLRLTQFLADGSTNEFDLDTIQKTLSLTIPSSGILVEAEVVYTLVE